MQKICSRCQVAQPLSSFVKRAASSDGRSAACAVCLAAAKRNSYWASSNERVAAVERSRRVKQARHAREPEYRRAMNLWGSTKRRTTLLPWTKATDFLDVCRRVLKAGPSYELDHIIPLRHPLVCGLHVPWNVRVVLKKTNVKKRNRFSV